MGKCRVYNILTILLVYFANGGFGSVAVVPQNPTNFLPQVSAIALPQKLKFMMQDIRKLISLYCHQQSVSAQPVSPAAL